jgi:hypothetical protein
VQRRESLLLGLRQITLRRDDEVHVAVLVGVADREGTDQVGPVEVVCQRGSRTRDQLVEHGVQISEPSRAQPLSRR